MLAHEAAHVHSDHVLYQTALQILLRRRASLPILAGLPLHGDPLALLEWSRGAELSCDRAAALVTRDPLAVCRALMVLAAGEAAEQLNLDAFIAQGMDYDEGGSGLERLSRLIQDLSVTHPMPVGASASCSTGCARASTTGSSAATTSTAARSRRCARRPTPPRRTTASGSKGAFEKAGTSISDVGDQLSEWLEKRKRSDTG